MELHRQQLEALAKNDPEFYAHLQKVAIKFLCCLLFPTLCFALFSSFLRAHARAHHTITHQQSDKGLLDFAGVEEDDEEDDEEDAEEAEEAEQPTKKKMSKKQKIAAKKAAKEDEEKTIREFTSAMLKTLKKQVN